MITAPIPVKQPISSLAPTVASTATFDRVEFSIVIPALNEAANIGETLDELSKFCGSTFATYEIIVIDDGSSDNTYEAALARRTLDGNIGVFRFEQKRGKGAAVRFGVRLSRGAIIAYTDADLPYRIESLEMAIQSITDGRIDIAIGARDLPESEIDASYPLARRLLGRVCSLLVTTLLLHGIPDTQCGLKVFTRDAALDAFGRAKIDSFGFDFEILYLAARAGKRIRRIPVTLCHRHESRVRLLRDSIQALVDIVRVRWGAYRPVSARACQICRGTAVAPLGFIRGYAVSSCSDCACQFLDTFPDPASLEATYSATYFASDNELACGYAAGRSESDELTARRRLSHVIRYARAGGSLLEIGCGTGTFGRLAAKQFEYRAIDLSAAAVEAARASGLNAEVGSAESLNLEPEFNAAVAWHVLEHLRDPVEALRAIRRALRPDGLLFVTTPDTESFLARVSGKRWVSYKFPEHLILFSERALIDLLHQSGFVVTVCKMDSEFCDYQFVSVRLRELHPWLSAMAWLLRPFLPTHFLVPNGETFIIARAV